jgi:hypothetical protein
MKKMHRRLLYQAVAFGFLASSACPSFAALAGAQDDFADAHALKDKELAGLRGGFALPSGVVVHFTYTSSINGVTQTHFSSEDLANAIRIDTQNKVNQALAKAGITPPATSPNTNNNVNTITSIKTDAPPLQQQQVDNAPPPSLPPAPPVIDTPPQDTPPTSNPAQDIVDHTIDQVINNNPGDVKDAVNDVKNDIADITTPPAHTPDDSTTPPITETVVDEPSHTPPPESPQTIAAITPPDNDTVQQTINLPNLTNVIQNSDNNVNIQFQQQLDMTLSNAQLAIDSHAVTNTMSQAALMNALAIR